MNSHFRIKTGVSLAALTGLALTCLLTSRAKADDWDKTTFLTVNQPVQVMNTYLEPGTYMFKLANSDRHIVQIFNKDRSHLYNTIFAVPNYRVNVTDRPVFTYWETPPGSVKAIRAWFYPDDHYGQEFTYPTQLRQVAAVTSLQVPAPAAPAQEPAVSTPAPAPAPIPEPEAQELAPPQPQEPVEIAQNNPPPPPTAPEAQEPTPIQNQPDQQNESLPRTASPYPLIGLAGLFSLALLLGLRLKQPK